MKRIHTASFFIDFFFIQYLTVRFLPIPYIKQYIFVLFIDSVTIYKL